MLLLIYCPALNIIHIYIEHIYTYTYANKHMYRQIHR